MSGTMRLSTASPAGAVTPSPAPEPAPEPAPAAPAAPAFVPKPWPLAAAYMLASLTLALCQGLGMQLISANVVQIQGAIGATQAEASWLIAAYMAPNVSMALALIKIRTQFGLRRFAETAILVFVAVSTLNLFVGDLHSAIVVRFVSGIAAAPMSTMAFLYMLEPFPPERKLTLALPLALTNLALAMPVARLVSPTLLDLGGFHGLTLFELALALVACGFVYLLPLTPIPRAKVIERMDIASFLLIAFGMGCLAVVLVLGRIYWWFEARWIGSTLVAAIVALTAAVVIELNRKAPLIDVRWIASPAIIHLTGALLIFRIVLSEQTTGASGFFQMLGLSNEQLADMWVLVLVATVAGGLVCARAMTAGYSEHSIHAVALALIAGGAWLDSSSTMLTRAPDMYVSQGMIAFASGLFLPPAMKAGLMSALKKGPNYILSFVIVFLTTQSLGGLLGSAVFGTFITWREKFHSAMIANRLDGADAFVQQRIAQLGGTYGRTLTDPALLKAEGVQLLGQQATQQANVLAYNDAFLLISMLALAALAGLLVHAAIKAIRARQDAGATPV